MKKLESELQSKCHEIDDLKFRIEQYQIDSQNHLQDSEQQKRLYNQLKLEYEISQRTIDDKNYEIQKILYNENKQAKEADALRLTEIIKAEVEKKYKEKLFEITAHLNTLNQNYKTRINEIGEEVTKISQVYNWEIEKLQLEKAKLNEKQYRSQQPQDSSEIGMVKE